MKYTLNERLEIGEKIYRSEMSRFQAAVKYNISSDTARDYMRLYRDTHNLPPKTAANKNKAEEKEKEER